MMHIYTGPEIKDLFEIFMSNFEGHFINWLGESDKRFLLANVPY